MKGYTIQHSIELLEKQASSGSGGASTASEVSFDNTGTGLVATNVQGALSELDTRDIYSTTETKVGTYDGKDLFRKIITVTGFTSDQVIVTNQMYYGSFTLADYITGVEMAFADILHSYLDISGAKRGIVFQQYEPDTGNMTLGTQFARTNVDIKLVVEYTKAAASEAKSTRKKK